MSIKRCDDCLQEVDTTISQEVAAHKIRGVGTCRFNQLPFVSVLRTDNPITGVTQPSSSTFRLTNLDGSHFDVTMPTGPQGPQGDQGTAPTAQQIQDAVNTYIAAHPPAAGATGATGATGSTGATGTTGASGADGRTILNGSGAPSGGNSGDFYIDTTANLIYGPKASGAWGSGTSIVGTTGSTGITGSAGATGAQGIQGIQGATGSTGATGAAGTNGTNATTTATATTSANGLMSSTDKTKLDAYPAYVAPSSGAATRSIVSAAAAANGFQVSSTRWARARYTVSIVTTATIGGGADGSVVVEICPTNSATAGDWIEVGRIRNGQVITLAVVLQSAQTIAGQLNVDIPTGYYTRLRSISTTGAPTFAYVSGQETLM